jgi:hypothetical protein
MIRQLRALLVSLFFLSLCAFGYAQNAQIQGQVSDSSGAVIPKAIVRVTNQLTGTERKVSTNGSGQYVVPGLDPSVYKIFVQAPGFSTAVSTPITLNVGQNALLDFRMQVGSETQSVTVDGSGVQINTTDGSVSTVVDRQFAENLPMNGRSFQSLVELAPGVVVTTSTNQDGGQFSVNGQRPSSNQWMVDGVSANVGVSTYYPPGNGFGGALGSFSAQGGTNSLVSVDAMQEFRIQTSTYAPEFGRMPGGQISIVTRSGTNEFHGTAFDYLRNDALDANDWFADHAGLAKAEERQNDFGGTFSGPIVRDSTFFFFSYEGLRLRLPQTALDTVPDLASRNTALPAMQAYLNAFPLPNGPEEGSGIAQLNATYSNSSTLDAYSLRIDRKLSDKLTVFARYNYSPSENLGRGGVGYSLSQVSPTRITMQTGTVGADWTLSSNLINEFRLNYSRTSAVSSNYIDSFKGAIPLVSIPLPAGYSLSNSQLFFDIFSLAGGEFDLGANLKNLLRQINIVDSATIERGKHIMKLGADYKRLSPRYAPLLYGQGAFFNDVPSTASGQLSFSDLQSNTATTILFHNLGIFAQDTWRIRPHVTLTYGLRWDVDFAPSSTDGPNFPAITGYNPYNLSSLALAPPGVPPFKTRFDNIAPRIGLAYQLLQRPGWDNVIRGGFGMFYDLASQEAGNLIAQSAYPFEAFSFSSGGTFPLSQASSAPPVIVPPGGGSGTLLAFDPNLQLPYSFQWNVAVEQTIGRQQSLSVSYVGAAGKRLIQTTEVLSPNSNYSEAIIASNAGQSNYNSLQAQFTRQLAHGLQALVSYTWSHSIDDASASSLGNAANAATPYVNPNVNRGPSDFDVRNTISAAATYNLPAPRVPEAFGLLLSDWSVQNVVQVRSAPPVNLYDSAFSYLNNSYTAVRPDSVVGQPQYLYGNQYPGGKALNPAAFDAPPVDANGNPTRQGDLARNALRGFGAAQWDFAIHRAFHLHKNTYLEFRSEMFNILNHPNFGQPVEDIQNPQFGQAIQMLGSSLGGSNIGGGGFSPLYQLGGPRSIQVALKLNF